MGEQATSEEGEEDQARRNDALTNFETYDGRSMSGPKPRRKSGRARMPKVDPSFCYSNADENGDNNHRNDANVEAAANAADPALLSSTLRSAGMASSFVDPDWAKEEGGVKRSRDEGGCSREFRGGKASVKGGGKKPRARQRGEQGAGARVVEQRGNGTQGTGEGAVGGGIGVLMGGQKMDLPPVSSLCVGSVASLRGVTGVRAETGPPRFFGNELSQRVLARGKGGASLPSSLPPSLEPP